MISAKTRGLLAQYFLQLGAIELEAERLRQKLCANPSFEPYSYFLELAVRDQISLTELKELAVRRKCVLRVQGIIGTILAHDTDFDGCLGYYDFLRMVLTTDDLNLRQTVSLRSKQQSVDDPTHEAFIRLLQHEAESAIKLQNTKSTLQRCYDFDVFDCFRALDPRDRGSIDYDQIRRFLIASTPPKLNKHQDSTPEAPIQQLVIAIIQRLTHHVGNERITYDTFSTHLKHQTNYIEQYSPCRLEKSRVESASCQANRMYSLYGQISESKHQTTPLKKKGLNLSQISVSNPFLTPSKSRIATLRVHTQKTPTNKSPLGTTISTPVRRTNLKSIAKNHHLFDRSVDKPKSTLPLRHSPLIVSKHPTKKVITHGRAASHIEWKPKTKRL